MTAATYHFDRFALDPTDRRLLEDGAPVALNARYFDALALLVREAGTLMPSIRRGAIAGAATGTAAGLLIATLGGKLMAGTLALLAARFPESRFRIDELGLLFGETGFGWATELVTAALEGALFTACVASAIVVARKLIAETPAGPSSPG